MATPTTDRRAQVLSGASLAALFAVSFGLTLWKVHPAFPEAAAAIGEMSGWSASGRTAPGQVGVATPESAPAVAPAQDGYVAAEPVVPPVQSLRNMADDADPAVRDEARALVGLLESEPAYD